MPLVHVSSKGQLVIPAEMRRALGIEKGARLRVALESGKIVLEPVRPASLLASLRGKYSSRDLLATLEEEHRRELEKEGSRR